MLTIKTLSCYGFGNLTPPKSLSVQLEDCMLCKLLNSCEMKILYFKLIIENQNPIYQEKSVYKKNV